MHKLVLIRFFFLINLILSPCFSSAEEFKHLSISLLGVKIGSVKLSETTTSNNKVILISGEVSSSPFKIFNGKFEYKTTIEEKSNGILSLSYESYIDTILKTRKIKFLVENDRLIDITISPPKEQTKFTNPKLINFKFIDPAYSFTNILNTPCKTSFKVYDGRRIVDIISMKPASNFECRYHYKIRSGPGHVYPFNFKNFEIVTYFERNRNLASKRMAVKAGAFTLILDLVG